jgi:hypothetical protein
LWVLKSWLQYLMCSTLLLYSAWGSMLWLQRYKAVLYNFWGKEISIFFILSRRNRSGAEFANYFNTIYQRSNINPWLKKRKWQGGNHN